MSACKLERATEKELKCHDISFACYDATFYVNQIPLARITCSQILVTFA